MLIIKVATGIWSLSNVLMYADSNVPGFEVYMLAVFFRAKANYDGFYC